jgi:phosphate:Na+ symporter
VQTLLNLLAGVSLLVWGTHIVRTGILRLFGSVSCASVSPSRCTRFSPAPESPR